MSPSRPHSLGTGSGRERTPPAPKGRALTGCAQQNLRQMSRASRSPGVSSFLYKFLVDKKEEHLLTIHWHCHDTVAQLLCQQSAASVLELFLTTRPADLMKARWMCLSSMRHGALCCGTRFARRFASIFVPCIVCDPEDGNTAFLRTV
jgi:hypothetical protein